MKTVLLLLMLFPLMGAALNALLGRYLTRRGVAAVACAAVLGALAMAVAAMVNTTAITRDIRLFDWFSVDGFQAVMNVHYDHLAAVMALMITFVSSVIHLYSVSFMREDEGIIRYFCYLNLFVFAMLVIALADNLIFVFLGWEGVGFCSYVLIGFWYSDEAKAAAGRKAFLLTRIGDAAFGVALGLFFLIFKDLSISHIVARTSLLSLGTATLLGLLLLWAAVGKSAQLPLLVWLPDAMAGPSPVSALIHAATMVTAGVYLLMRLFPILILSPAALMCTAIVGTLTALFGSFAALVQSDIKRVLAYSTISQVGYMLLAVGVADIVGGMFHLLSHAFFKSLLFLAAGCIIQALAGEHNIFRMGNLRRHLPGVSLLFLAGCLCLGTFPLLGGYFSKDRILLATFVHSGELSKVLWVIGMAAAFLTSLYTFRLYFIAFQDRPDGRKKDEFLQIPGFMSWVLYPLALTALFDGLLNLPGGFGKLFLGRYLASVPGSIVEVHATAREIWGMRIGSAALSLGGMVSAYFLWRRKSEEPALRGLRQVLFTGFYLDIFYERVIARPYNRIAGLLWTDIDEGGLDRGSEKIGGGFQRLSQGLRLWTTGRLSTYLRMLFLGFAALLCLLSLSWYIQ